MVPLLLGTLLALGTAFCFGSFTSFNKVPSVVSSNVNPIVFNFYYISGVFVSSICAYIAAVIIGFTVEFTYLGLLSAILLILAGFFSFLAIPKIGVAYTWAVAASTGVVTAFIEGIIVGNTITHWWATIVSLCILITGAVSIILIKDISNCLFKSKDLKMLKQTVYENEVSMQQVLDKEELEQEESEESETIPLNNNHGTTTTVVELEAIQEQVISKFDKFSGLFYSVITGIMLASIPLPSIYASINASGICYFYSLGLGCLFVIPFTLFALIFDGIIQSKKQSEEKFEGLGYAFNESNFVEDDNNCILRCLNNTKLGIKHLFCGENNVSLWKLKTCLLPGFMSGIVWNVGNICGIISLQYISFIFVNALVTVSMVVSAIYGVFLWRELSKLHEILLLFLGSFLVIGANVLLAYGLYGEFW